jgi:tRNA A37 threonylcarbamoyladenosine dehydratase
MQCQKAGVPIISSMGAGNKLDPTQFRVADIYKTKMDPLAKVMRRELKKRGVTKLKVVYSEEEPISLPESEPQPNGRRSTPGSTAFVPSVAGLIIAGEVIKDLTGKNTNS